MAAACEEVRIPEAPNDSQHHKSSTTRSYEGTVDNHQTDLEHSGEDVSMPKSTATKNTRLLGPNEPKEHVGRFIEAGCNRRKHLSKKT